LIHGAFGPIPRDLERAPFPTAGLFIDSYNGTENQARFAELFDYAFVFHPSSVAAFRSRGHPGVHLLPHAADHRLFSTYAREERSLEVGWVGVARGAIYSRRRRCLELLRNAFVMNDPERTYSLEELASIYGSSKVVVNISRDDYPEDANLRCFEALGSGAALITIAPTELTELGFQSGEHFIGVGHVDEVPGAVHSLLADEHKRRQLARRGQEAFLGRHTYDHRARQLLELTLTGASRAPVRAQAPENVHEQYAFWYAKNGCLEEALSASLAAGLARRNLPIRPLWWTARAMMARLLQH
jgi:spore maturation protein CgeB